MMCAARLERSQRVLVLEGNEKVGAKIAVSGGGKCNITNKYVDKSNYVGNLKYVHETLARFDNKALLAYLQNRGLEPVLKKGRFYFCPKSAQQLIDLLKRETKEKEFLLKTKVHTVTKDANKLFYIETSRGVFHAKKVVIASGGKSFPSLGATDVALEIAKSFQMAYSDFKPALVGLTLQREQFWFKTLTGVSLDVAISVNGKKIAGSLLFAHRGISGPAVLNTSLYWKKGEITVDFFPGGDVETLVRKGNKRHISSVIPLPKRFVKAFLEHIGLEDKACNRLQDVEFKQLKRLHAYTFAPAGNFGFSKAEVSLGGIDPEELYSTFESKTIEGLYILGEALDVTGELGGYNFQWAFSSAVVCAADINEKSKNK